MLLLLDWGWIIVKLVVSGGFQQLVPKITLIIETSFCKVEQN